MSKEEKQHLQQRLYGESIVMAEKFQRLISDTTESLKRQKVTVREILCHLVGLGPLLPTYDDLKLPVFRRQLPALRKAKSVDDAMQVIGDYCSFFNFRMIDHIISKLGTIRDKKNLSKYEEEFHNYCQHHIFECPSELGSISSDHANMFVKLDKTYDNCTIEILHIFVNKLWSIFNVSSATGLKLCRIERGCLKLTFQLPVAALQDIFPLSREQEAALSSLGVDSLWLIYHFNRLQHQVLFSCLFVFPLASMIPIVMSILENAYTMLHANGNNTVLLICLSQPETKELHETVGESEEETTTSDSKKSTVDNEETVTGDAITLDGRCSKV